MADQSKEVYGIFGKDHPTEPDFQRLLERTAPGVFAKQYLSSGLPFVFKDQPQKYRAFREAAGRIFGVAPQQIAVMGSARFGFRTCMVSNSSAWTDCFYKCERAELFCSHAPKVIRTLHRAIC